MAAEDAAAPVRGLAGVTEALISILLNLLAPSGYQAAKDVAYGEGPRRTLDVYAPKQVDAAAPVVVFFYGGSWDSGDKGFYRFVGEVLASNGIVAVIPDYRVYPEVTYPGFVEDGAQAVTWARDHARDYGGDPNRLILLGHSAGAHIAAALTYDGRWLKAQGVDVDREIAAFVGLSGPYDFLPLRSEKLKIIFGPEATRADTQPINHVTGSAPPALLLAGGGDTVVDPGNTTRLAARVTQAGGQAEARIYPGVSHAGTITAFLPLLRGRLTVLKDVLDYIREVKPPSAQREAA